jgi:hypothetical protein
MFPVFPKFIPLSLELKEPYNRTIGSFPPYSDISFTTLQIWWNLSEDLSVSLLNQNLVINYVLPNDATNSGLSLVGKINIDEAISTVFHYLKQNGKDVRLVHVPEFVVNKIVNSSKFKLHEEHDYNEYILDSSALTHLEGHEYQLLRKKIRRFGKHVDGKQLEIKELDLSLGRVQDELFRSIAEWESKNSPENDPEHSEHHAIKKAINNALPLEIKNMALFIDNELHGIIIYHRPLDKEYYVLHHLKANYDSPYISDYLYHQMAKKAVDNGVSKLNIEMDLGIENLKRHKMTLRPDSFLKKYTIIPVEAAG